MKITYYIDGTLKTTRENCQDLSFSEENGGKKITVTAHGKIELVSAEIGFSFKKTPFSPVFVNGYQSWTATKEFLPDDEKKASERQRDLGKLPRFLEKIFAFKAYGLQAFYPADRNYHIGVDYAYIKGENQLFIGNRNFKNAYLVIKIQKDGENVLLISDVYGKHLGNGESFVLFDYVTFGDALRGQEEYFAGFSPRSSKKLFGYTSWYNHYQDIDEAKICKALDEADDRFDLFQIDDGFEPFVGDWEEVNKLKFPSGLKPVVEKIHAKGMMAGIWLAPFAAEKDSLIFKQHYEWIAKDDNGTPIPAGANWSGFYPLDLNNEEAVEHIGNILHRYAKIGFDFFKLDFLYVCNLKPLCGKTRAETSEFAYSILEKELEGKLILGCGAALSSGYGKFDFMRIGPDVSLKFDDKWFMRILHPERISTKITLQNTIYRSAMNGKVFLNDPDVFLLRDDNINLSEDQRYALTKINALFGSLLMTSDDPKTYDAKKTKVLDEALQLFKNGKVTGYVREGKYVKVNYELNGKPFSFKYNTLKGVIENG